MLKGIPSVLSPQLLKVLMEMGHGDELVLADGNFPSETCGQRVVRLDGHGVPGILDAVLQLLPLDTYVQAPVCLMQNGANDPKPEIWDIYDRIIQKHQPGVKTELIERFAFYDRAKKAYAVVATGEGAVYANIILKKGVVK